LLNRCYHLILLFLNLPLFLILLVVRHDEGVGGGGRPAVEGEGVRLMRSITSVASTALAEVLLCLLGGK